MTHLQFCKNGSVVKIIHFQFLREISPKSIVISFDEEIELMIDASEVFQKGFIMPRTIIDLKDF